LSRFEFLPMRIALISDSPTLPTGFARTTRCLVKALADRGHEVSCFGIGHGGETYDRTLYPCTIWAAGDDIDVSQEMFPHFLAREKPDVILINYDLLMTCLWLNVAAKVAPNVAIVSHLIIDGLPVYPEFFKSFNRCAAILTATQCVRELVAAEATAPVYYLPHLVDCEKFLPLEDAEAVKRALFGDSLVVGTIAQNRGRKQLVQTIHAIRLLRDAGRRPVFLLHTDRVKGLRHGGNPLRKVIESFGVEDIVHVTESHRQIDAAAGDATVTSSRFGRSLALDHLRDLTVAERLNLCDVAVIASSYGGFEYGIVEAQACGVPVCVTDDGGIMMEVAGGACEPMRPSLFELAEYGAKIWKLSPDTIATAIVNVADQPSHRASLQTRGRQNVQRYDRAMNEAALADTLEEVLALLPSPMKSRVA